METGSPIRESPGAEARDGETVGNALLEFLERQVGRTTGKTHFRVVIV